MGLAISGDHRIRSLLAAPCLVLLTLTPTICTQTRPASRTEQPGQKSENAKAKGLAEPFVGITATGQLMPRLFAIRPATTSMEPVRGAAQEFLDSMNEEQQFEFTFGINDLEWRKWMGQHSYVARGLSFKEMNEEQREKALELLRASLSDKGLKLVLNIMKLNRTLGELNIKRLKEFDELRYHIKMFGEPSKTNPWGWQLDGHHAAINYFVLGDQIVMTPFFVGAEPVVARSGKYEGITVLQEEQNKGLAMVNALGDEQRKKAILNSSKTGNNNLTEAFKDNLVLDYAGIYGAELSDSQRRQLLDLIELYVGKMPEPHAQAKMHEVRRHLDTTWFAWHGGTDVKSVFYYRIYSPVLLIEFDHQLPENLRSRTYGRGNTPTREHIHVVVRTPNGNDYGKHLLHLQQNQPPHKHH